MVHLLSGIGPRKYIGYGWTSVIRLRYQKHLTKFRVVPQKSRLRLYTFSSSCKV